MRKWDGWKCKIAISVELIIDFGNEDKGIGSRSDQIAPFVCVARVKGDTVLAPLVQHYVEYAGPHVDQTAFRLIDIQSLPAKVLGQKGVEFEFDN